VRECTRQHTVQIKGDRHRELPPSGSPTSRHCVRDPLGVTQKKEGEDRNENDHPGSESQQDAREGITERRRRPGGDAIARGRPGPPRPPSSER